MYRILFIEECRYVCGLEASTEEGLYEKLREDLKRYNEPDYTINCKDSTGKWIGILANPDLFEVVQVPDGCDDYDSV